MVLLRGDIINKSILPFLSIRIWPLAWISTTLTWFCNKWNKHYHISVFMYKHSRQQIRWGHSWWPRVYTSDNVHLESTLSWNGFINRESRLEWSNLWRKYHEARANSNPNYRRTCRPKHIHLGHCVREIIKWQLPLYSEWDT